MLSKDFYKKVEEPGFLKHILYGDSVHPDSIIEFNNLQISIDDLWNLLAIQRGIDTDFSCFRGDKEYISCYSDMTSTMSIDNGPHISKIKYIEKNTYDGKMWTITSDSGKQITVTDQHSLINIMNYNDFSNKKRLGTVLPEYAEIVIEDDGEEHLIIDKYCFQYTGYVYDICVPETQNFFANGICVHNTDSLFVKIPYKGAENKTAEERWKITQKGASLINGSIIKYYNEWLLPRSNILIEHNKTDFKPELTILIILFLSVKKNYAYLYDVKEGEIYNTPKLKKTSNLGIKSDMSIMTRNLLDDLLAKISLNTNITNKYEACVNIYKSYREKYIELINQYDFGDISIPGKWGKKALTFNGMKIYNFMVGKDVFSFGSAGKFIYCEFKNKTLLDNSGVLQKDMSGFCFPYVYDKDLLRRKMVDYGITIDIETQWNKIFTTTCERVFEILKNY